MIQRFYDNLLSDYLVPNKVLVIYEPRQVDKTTLVNRFTKKSLAFNQLLHIEQRVYHKWQGRGRVTKVRSGKRKTVN